MKTITLSRHVTANFSLFVLIISFISARGDSGTWNGSNSNLDWNYGPNWSSGTIPNDTGQVATFAGAGYHGSIIQVIDSLPS
jgi:hypothetical protein